ncbi:MAG: hypothetical protein IIU03_06625 [Bacteroidales bacterium]|nr:hypothetical protein [Bacteroidales bacterium]MBQ5539896.1 hypothetical protein [Bacteroidales bacterium]MBR4677629.1 hypothetical protein [Bacteroidales bacterium]
MYTVNLDLDKETEENIKMSYNITIPFQIWLQQQIMLLLQEKFCPQKRRRKYHSRGLTDEELEKELSDYKPLTDDDIPDLSRKDYLKLCSRKPIMSNDLKKWF